MSEMKKCKTCDSDIASDAKRCPHCGAKIKKPIYKKWWFYVLITLSLIITVAAFGSDDSSSDNAQQSSSISQGTESSKKETREYVKYDVSTLIDDLDKNALSAETKHQDEYVELTGKLSTIDSDGKYICLDSSNGDFTFISVRCELSNQEQKDKVMNFSKGDTVTIKGKITDIGEVLGYTIRIDEIE